MLFESRDYPPDSQTETANESRRDKCVQGDDAQYRRLVLPHGFRRERSDVIRGVPLASASRERNV